jgi:hypothetical protein
VTTTPFAQETESQLSERLPTWDPWQGPAQPGFWSGMGFNESTHYLGPLDVLGRGIASGASKGAAVLTGLWGREYDVLGRIGEALHIPGATASRNEAQYLQGLSETATDNAKRVLPDAATTGTAASILQGLGSGTELFLAGGGGLGSAIAVGAGEGTAKKRDLAAQGVSSPVANIEGAVTGITSALGAMMPGGFGKTLLARIATGAGANVAFGAAGRYADHLILDKAGYPEMAAQQKALDSGSLLADAVLGGAFGALSHLHGSEDAARTMTVANADRQSAPGVATDPLASGAHQAALEKATADLMSSKPVDVSETGIHDAQFTAREEPNAALGEHSVVQAFRDADILTEQQNLSHLEEQLAARMRGEKPVERVPTEPTEPLEAKPAAAPVEQALAERPEMQIPTERGTQPAAEAFQGATDAVQTGERELPIAAQAALNCFSRRS